MEGNPGDTHPIDGAGVTAGGRLASAIKGCHKAAERPCGCGVISADAEAECRERGDAETGVGATRGAAFDLPRSYFYLYYLRTRRAASGAHLRTELQREGRSCVEPAVNSTVSRACNFAILR